MIHNNVVVVVENKDDLQTILDELIMKINPEETIILVHSRNNNIRTKKGARKNQKDKANRRVYVLGKYYKYRWENNKTSQSS